MFESLTVLAMLAALTLITTTIACSVRTEATPIKPSKPAGTSSGLVIPAGGSATLSTSLGELDGSAGGLAPITDEDGLIGYALRFSVMTVDGADEMTLMADDYSIKLTAADAKVLISALEGGLKKLEGSKAGEGEETTSGEEDAISGMFVPYNGEGTQAVSGTEALAEPLSPQEGEPRWVVSEGAAVYWSDAPQIVHAYHQGNKKTAQAQADKMNELGLDATWSSGLPIEEVNKIREQLRGPGMTSLNYMD